MRTGSPIKPHDNPAAAGGCWGGMKIMGYCYKKPRPGRLTCWHHRDQEGPAERLKKRLEAEEEERLLRETCFHCGDPAMPKTFGEVPRCERHYDVP